MKALTLILTFSIIVVLSHATPTMFYRHRPPSYITKPQNGTCKYTITVKTSFLSQADTKKLFISIFFGDAKDRWIDINKLNDTQSKMFGQNAKSIFTTMGPCLDKICKVSIVQEPLKSLFLWRAKQDSMKWIIEYVTIEDSMNPPITFYFDLDDYRRNFCDIFWF
uniref:Embryo-specific protein ATS3A-like n=1 Tax=Cicer arietinum TaxID=3827 RepID=A0A1S3E611_CICAR|nr:embryo-specific protein ATS3A-like [Cicer arietinum]